MPTCYLCGDAVPPGARACPLCGTALAPGGTAPPAPGGSPSQYGLELMPEAELTWDATGAYAVPESVKTPPGDDVTERMNGLPGPPTAVLPLAIPVPVDEIPVLPVAMPVEAPPPLPVTRVCPACRKTYGPDYADNFCACGLELVIAGAPAPEAAAPPGPPAPAAERPPAGTRCLVLYGPQRQPVRYFPLRKDVTLIGRQDAVRGTFPDIDVIDCLDAA